MSTAGLGTLASIIIHGLFILMSLTILAYTFFKTGKKRLFSGFTFILVCGIYTFWLTTKVNWKKDIEKSYIGNYNLTNYKGCKDCIIELKADRTYQIHDKTKNYESGTWKYFDDGDIFFVEFNNGGQLGSNEYEYRQK